MPYILDMLDMSGSLLIIASCLEVFVKPSATRLIDFKLFFKFSYVSLHILSLSSIWLWKGSTEVFTGI